MIPETRDLNVNWKLVEKILDKAIPEIPKNLAIKKSIKELISNFLIQSTMETKETLTVSPIYLINNVTYQANSQTLNLREELVKQLVQLKFSEIFSCQRKLKDFVKKEGAFLYEQRGTFQLFNNLLRISLVRQMAEVSEDATKDAYLLAELGDCEYALNLITEKWRKQDENLAFEVNSFCKNNESIRSELALKDDLLELLNKWQIADSIKEKDLFEKEILHLVEKYKLPEFTSEGHQIYKDRTFSQKINELQLKISALIERIFKPEADKIKNLKEQLESIELRKAQILPVMMFPGSGSEDHDCERLSEIFIKKGAFDQALRSILIIKEPIIRYNKLIELMAILLNNGLKEKLYEVIENVLASEEIAKNLHYLNDKLNDVISVASQNDIEDPFSRHLLGKVNVSVLKNLHELCCSKIKEKRNDIELTPSSK